MLLRLNLRHCIRINDARSCVYGAGGLSVSINRSIYRAHGFSTLPPEGLESQIKDSKASLPGVESSFPRVQDIGPIVHPEYSDPDADASIESSDGMRFKVHSLIIRLASDKLSGIVAGSKNVRLEEDKVVVKALLNSIYPRRHPPKLEPFSFVSILAEAAVKYDILDVTLRVKESLSHVRPKHPGTALQRYALASRHGWDDEARHASRYIPPPNSENAEQKPILGSMDTISLLKLTNLHRRRQDILKKALAISHNQNLPDDERAPHLRWEEISKQHVENCHSRAHDNAAWTAFKLLILKESDRHSPYEFSNRLENWFWKTNQTNILWNDMCTKCSKPFFDKDSFVSEFTRIVDSLPTEIE